jgi:hypothetical protein
VRVGDTERPPVLPSDLELLAAHVVNARVKLVIVDPLMAFIGMEYDAHRDQDIRRCLSPLAHLAERLHICILLLRHLNKLNGGAALYRGGGSIGISAAARSALIVGRDPHDPTGLVRVLAPNKVSITAEPKSLAYRLEPVIHPQAGTMPRVVWLGETDLKANDILGHGGSGPGRPAKESATARELLQELLTNGPVEVAKIKEEAASAGVCWRTVQTAKADLNIDAFKDGRVWKWRLVGDGKPCASEERKNYGPWDGSCALPFDDPV